MNDDKTLTIDRPLFTCMTGAIVAAEQPLAAEGGGQAVLRDFKTAVNFGASDPRKDGAAIPVPRF
jgi:hypothetical protein